MYIYVERERERENTLSQIYNINRCLKWHTFVATSYASIDNIIVKANKNELLHNRVND
jgi:hypothetical protein